MKKNITIIGTGYVGLVTGACLAESGNKVFCVDIDQSRISSLNNGIIPFFEPGLGKIVERNLKKRRLFFNTDLSVAMAQSEIIFITVGTPPKENGEADLSYIDKVAYDIGRNLKQYKIIAVKSTVPTGTCRRIMEMIGKYSKAKFDIVSNPEFLREGSAVLDFLKPDRIIVGLESKKAESILKKLYTPFKAPIIFTSIESSEMIKYSSNAFLATKISFINEIANVCERVGADVGEIAKGMGLDSRIGSGFLQAGIGYGGSCFPKDVKALYQSAGINGYEFCLLRSVIEVNKNQKKFIIEKTERLLKGLKNKTIGVWGLAFKANTDDVRESAAIEIINVFLEKGAAIKVYDPMAIDNAKKVLPKEVFFCGSPYEAIKGSDVLFIATEWDEFKKINFVKIKKMLKQPNIVDGKNIFDPIIMKKKGFNYTSVGR